MGENVTFDPEYRQKRPYVKFCRLQDIYSYCVIDRTCNATDYILMICLSFIKSFISSELPIAPAHQLSGSAAFATKDSLNVKLRRKYIRDDGHSVGHTKKPSHNKPRLFDLLMMGGEAKKGEK